MIGHREGSMSKEFKRVIPGAAFLGAVIISAIGVLGDVTGALAGGAGTFMGLHIVQTYMAMGMMVRPILSRIVPAMLTFVCRSLDTARCQARQR